jgi:hypothetical protein
MEFEQGDRVVYTPLGSYGYTHLAGRPGTVRMLDSKNDWAYVAFDFSPQYGLLPCAAEELERVEVTSEV